MKEKEVLNEEVQEGTRKRKISKKNNLNVRRIRAFLEKINPGTKKRIIYLLSRNRYCKLTEMQECHLKLQSRARSALIKAHQSDYNNPEPTFLHFHRCWYVIKQNPGNRRLSIL